MEIINVNFFEEINKKQADVAKKMALSSLTSEIRIFRLNKEGNRVILDLEIEGATDRRLTR
jgi:ribosomal protein L4